MDCRLCGSGRHNEDGCGIFVGWLALWPIPMPTKCRNPRI